MMIMRKSIVAGIVTLAASVALLTGTGSAQAETAQVIEQSSRVGTADGASRAQDYEYEYYDWYWTTGNCLYAGRELQKNDSSIITYKCAQNTWNTWSLYLLK